MEERKEIENTMPQRKDKKTTVLAGAIVLLLALTGFFAFKALNPPETAVILQTNEEVHSADTTGTVRISVSPTITVKDGTMQDLNFFNTNENRLMAIKLYTQKDGEIQDIIYDSPKIETNKVIAGDYVDTSKLEKGSNTVMAEVFYYDLDENLIGQTNVEDITLEYES